MNICKASNFSNVNLSPYSDNKVMTSLPGNADEGIPGKDGGNEKDLHFGSFAGETTLHGIAKAVNSDYSKIRR